MMEHQANALALIFGGKPWQSYPGYWLLVHSREDGAPVVFDREVVCLYDDERAMEDGETACEIRLNISHNTNESGAHTDRMEYDHD